MEDYTKHVAPEYQFTEEERKFMKNVCDPEQNRKEIEKVLKDEGIFCTAPKEGKFPENVLNHDIEEVEDFTPIDVLAGVDPETGINTKIDTKKIEEEYNSVDEDIDIYDVVLTDKIIPVIQEMVVCTEDEAKEFIQLMKEYKKEKTTKGLFKRLPKSFKSTIGQMCGGSTDVAIKNTATKALFDNVFTFLKSDDIILETQTEADKAFEEFGQEIDELGKEFGVDNPQKALLLRNKAEDDMKYIIKPRAVIDKYKDSEDPEKIEMCNKLKSIVTHYYDATHFRSLIRGLEDHIPASKRLYKDIKKYNYYVRQFNHKYDNSTHKAMYDLNAVYDIMIRKLKYSKETCEAFIVYFCKFVINHSNKDNNKWIYAFFTLKTIVSIETLTIGVDKEADEVYNTLYKILDLIEEGR